MTVAICDDDIIFRNELKEFLIKYNNEHGFDFDIIEFQDGNSLLDYKNELDIVFIDYQMPGIDGLSAAHILRKRKNLCCIIFLSNFPEYVFDAFEVNAYRYFVKPLDERKLTRAIDNFIADKKMFIPILVTVDNEQILINSEDIIYLEADGKSCYIRTPDATLKVSKTISKIFEDLPKYCFYRTHKSFAVNFYCIQSVKDNCITLNNGEKVQISRSNTANFKKAYRNFIKYFIVRM